jgi:hypothetical protein
MSFCLDETIIADYLSGQLSFIRRYQLKRHLASCKKCLDELLILHQMQKAQENENFKHTKMPSHSVNHIVYLINQQLNPKYVPWKSSKSSLKKTFTGFINRVKKFGCPVNHFIPAMQPIPVLRGFSKIMRTEMSEQHIDIQKKIDALKVNIFFQRSKDAQVVMEIHVTQDKRPAQNVRLTCIRKNDGLDSRLLKDKVIFYDCPFDQYTMIISQHDTERGRFVFDINADGIYEQENIED